MEMSKIKNGKTTERIGEIQRLFFQKINKADKCLASLTRKREQEDTNIQNQK